MEVIGSIPEAAIDLIKRFEGLKLISYQDSVGVWTIGYGHTKGVKPNIKISVAAATTLLMQDLKIAYLATARLISVPITSNQLSALLSFVFNLGSGALQRSSLRAKLNRDEYEDAADEFLKWVYAGGMKLKGLLLRRQAERQLFLK